MAIFIKLKKTSIMDKITSNSIEQQLLSAWLKGWPQYATNAYDDYPAILKLLPKIAEQLNVDPEEATGFERCCKAFENIANYCKWNLPWARRNIYYTNMCFQTLYNEMLSVKRISTKNCK